MLKIAILDDYQNCALELADWDRLRDRCEIQVFTGFSPMGDALVRQLEPFHIICAMRERTPFPRDLLQQLPNLKLLVSSGRVNASIDTAAASELGITTAGTGSTGFGAAELTFTLLLALSRNLVPELLSLREGGWQKQLGRDLNGATLGIIGLGRLGARVAGYAQAFGMRVIAWSQNLTADRAGELNVEPVSKETLLAEADYVTLHLRLSARTTGVIGAEELKQMKPGACLINTSRGEVVDEAALIEALNNGTIAGAGIDVFSTEPLPVDHPMRTTPNLLATPHIGYVTKPTFEAFYREMVGIIDTFLRGGEVPRLN